jgi:tetratricopeptide (TPR) repeat protein
MEAWKKFIRGRFAQEQGREEDALREFEQALEIDPENQCFRDATKVAQRNLHRNLNPLEEHLLVHVQQGYEELAQTLTSQKDERVEGLKQVLAELEGRPPIDVHVRTYKGGPHCGWSKGRKDRRARPKVTLKRVGVGNLRTFKLIGLLCTFRLKRRAEGYAEHLHFLSPR